MTSMRVDVIFFIKIQLDKTNKVLYNKRKYLKNKKIVRVY